MELCQIYFLKSFDHDLETARHYLDKSQKALEICFKLVASDTPEYHNGGDLGGENFLWQKTKLCSVQLDMLIREVLLSKVANWAEICNFLGTKRSGEE